jgi:serine/threonine-protein kinase
VALDEELHREVALKEIQGQHADNQESRSRFLLEAEVTGGLEHPGIVPVYGLGQYADGRPFYAMRFIRGDNLKDAIERFHKAEGQNRDSSERALALRQLLRRFIDVCNAIAYAHSRGVLHRDLKPGNIMLGSYGETLVVDWGLAKPLEKLEGVPPSLEAPLQPSSLSGAMPTLAGEAMGTPQYMSPEQAEGRLDQLGPASDVYSLGATLYCLMTGRSPFDDPDIGTVLSKVQRGEFAKPREVNKTVPQALEAICLKAMSLRAGDRYASPRAMADDIEHWLADERVSAWQEPWTVRMRRWVRRHRPLVAGSVAAATVATISLAVATVLLTAANRRERAARELAIEREREAAANYQLARKAVDRYHTEVSESVLLHEPGLEPLRKKLLEAAREFYEKFVQERGHGTEVQAELGRAVFRLAQITGEIGSEQTALDLHKEALQIFAKLASGRRTTEEFQSDLASSYYQLGRIYRLTDQPAESEKSFQQALRVWHRLLDEQPGTERYHAEAARAQLGLGNLYQQMKRLPEAAAAYENSLVMRERLLSARPGTAEYRRDIGVSLNNLGMVYTALGETAKAKDIFSRAALLQEGLARDHPTISQYQDDLARTNYNLGDLLVRLTKFSAAEAAYEKSLEIWEKLTGTHPDVSRFQTRLTEACLALAGVLAADKQIARAEDVCRRALTIRRKLAGEHPNVPSYQGDLSRCYWQIANIYRKAGQTNGATDAYRECIAMQEKIVKDYSKIPQYRGDLASSYNNLGLLYQDMDAKEQAGKAYHAALALWDKLAEEYPAEPLYAVGASSSCFNLGMLSRSNAKLADAKNSFSEAEGWYKGALKRLDGLSAAKRDQAVVKERAREAHRGLADILTQLARYPEAIVEWDRAIALDERPGKPLLRAHRALTRARSGDHRMATVEAAEISKQAASDGDVLFLLAGVYCVSARLADKDTNLPTDERGKRKEQYLLAAGDLLAKAHQAGYFKNRANLANLRTDPDLNDLRSRETFQKMLKESERASTS